MMNLIMNLAMFQTEARVKKKGERKEEKAREKEVNTLFLKFLCFVCLIVCLYNHFKTKEQRKQKEVDVAEQYLDHHHHHTFD